MTNKRIAIVSTAFAGVEMHIQQLVAVENLGRPFRFQVELLCDDMDLDLNKQLGKPLTVEIETRTAKRYFTGLVSQMTFAGMQAHQARYLAIVRPWVWFLTHRSDNRVFQEKNVPDIIKKVVGDHGFSCKNSLTATYRNRDYCVQYGESDFDFISRLMEEEGIYYFFEHQDGRHDMVLADSSSAHNPFAGYAQVKFFPPSEGQREEDHISNWGLSHRVETQKFVVDSYNFTEPEGKLKGEKKIPQKHGEAGSEQYEYGQLYPLKKDGDALSKVRAEEQQVNYAIVTGSGDVRGLCCGSQFELTNYPRRDQNTKYLLIAATHHFVNSEFETGMGSEASFACDFSAIDLKTQFRPARSTPRAVVRGPQTAVVVGPSGEEIWTDKYGRVKVQFHWDRDGDSNEKSSCWVRVGHGSAGQKWGMISIPRIGQEVIVDFLEGDPDQPIITGSVYNDSNMPPYDLPANQTQSGIKTRSSKDGVAKDFNELRFEDKKDAEEVYFHAEHNFNRVVENNDTLKVGWDDKDEGDQTIDIYNNRTVTLHDGKEGHDSLTLKKGDQTVTVEKGDQTVKIQKGNQTIDVKKKIKIDAGDELVITVGQAKLTMKKNGEITMKGMKIKFTATNSVEIKGTSKVDVKGAMVKIKADASAEVKGAMTKVEGSGILDLKGGGMAKLKGGVTMIG